MLVEDDYAEVARVRGDLSGDWPGDRCVYPTDPWLSKGLTLPGSTMANHFFNPTVVEVAGTQSAFDVFRSFLAPQTGVQKRRV